MTMIKVKMLKQVDTANGIIKRNRVLEIPIQKYPSWAKKGYCKLHKPDISKSVEFGENADQITTGTIESDNRGE